MELNPHTDKKIYWEHKMSELFNMDNLDHCTIHFEYTPDSAIFNNGKTLLKVKTYNPKKIATFLLVESSASSEGECAEYAYTELIHMINSDGYSTYTIEWHKKDDHTIQLSYFYAKNVFDALTKLYHDMGPDNVIFHSMKLNPIS